MILSGTHIAELVKKGEIGIDPFDDKNLRDASYVFTLSNRLAFLKKTDVLIGGVMPALEELVISPEGFLLKPGAFIIGYTREHLHLGGKYSCLISTRGEAAHVGLNVTQSSFYAEPNTNSPLALEMSNQSPYPIQLTIGMALAKGIFLPLYTKA